MPAKKKTITEAKPADTAASPATEEAIGSEDRHLMISEAAYFRALERGFEGGNPEEDWYAAEADIRRVFRAM
ncbi:MAG: DUF2934 domain-containing protein [Gammaproteobacteria bacterium]|jgi:hypothetical protein